MPFNSSIADLNDKSAIVNKIQEIVIFCFEIFDKVRKNKLNYIRKQGAANIRRHE